MWRDVGRFRVHVGVTGFLMSEELWSDADFVQILVVKLIIVRIQIARLELLSVIGTIQQEADRRRATCQTTYRSFQGLVEWRVCVAQDSFVCLTDAGSFCWTDGDIRIVFRQKSVMQSVKYSMQSFVDNVEETSFASYCILNYSKIIDTNAAFARLWVERVLSRTTYATSCDIRRKRTWILFRLTDYWHSIELDVCGFCIVSCRKWRLWDRRVEYHVCAFFVVENESLRSDQEDDDLFTCNSLMIGDDRKVFRRTSSVIWIKRSVGSWILFDVMVRDSLESLTGRRCVRRRP